MLAAELAARYRLSWNCSEKLGTKAAVACIIT
jgi:hypothetical protein